MLLCRLQIPPVHELSPEINQTSSVTPAQVFNHLNQHRLAGVISQLALLTDYATDVFTNILSDAQSTHNRIQDLAERTRNLQMSLPNTQKFFTAPNALEKMNVTSGQAFRSDAAGSHKLVTHESRPKGMNMVYQSAEPAPNFTAFEKFEGGKKAQSNYTNPDFFLSEWIAEQQKELDLLQKERKKRKKERALARAQDREDKTTGIQRLKRIRYDPATGRPIVEEGPQDSDQSSRSNNINNNTNNNYNIPDDGDEEDINELTRSKLHKLRPKRERPNNFLTSSDNSLTSPPSAPSTIQTPTGADDFLFTQRGAPPPPPRERNPSQPRVPPAIVSPTPGTTVVPPQTATPIPPSISNLPAAGTGGLTSSPYVTPSTDVSGGEIVAPAPPPLPSRDSQAPPVPPPSYPQPSVPATSTSPTGAVPPPPPPLPPPSSSGGPPPPPPLPVPSAPRPATSEIAAPSASPKSPGNAPPIMEDTTSALMSQIRAGIKLKQVEKNDKKEVKDSTDIGEILRRRMAIAGSDSDDSLGDDDDDDGGWDDE